MKLSLTLILFVATAWAQPVITAVLDGAAYTNNIAPGSVFVVKGMGLSAPGQSSATSVPYPAALNNVRITLSAVAGGVTVAPRMIYTYNLSGVNQLAALLPSSAATGAYDLRVENGAATSAPFRTSIVARKLGIVTATGDGQGEAQATLDGKLILQRPTNQGKLGDFETRPARLGERIDLWGTGLGADLASDNGGTSGDQTSTAQVRVLVDGSEVTPLFAGRSNGYPGLDQIVFTLPPTAALSCSVIIEVRVGSTLSNPVSLATGSGDACPASTSIRINEVESNGGTPGDWVELFNPGPGPQALGGFVFKDNDDSRNHVLPAVTVPPGGYFLLEEADFIFGLGAADSTRLYRPDGTLAASYTWTTHAANTYGRCPNGSGAFLNTTTVTKGSANDCGNPIRINEIESEGGSPGDWVELFNPRAAPLDVSGLVLRDNVDSNTYNIPPGSVIPALGYLVLEAAAFNFDLGPGHSVRLFDTAGNLLDSYSWTSHATTTYGRCPNGSGAFTTTASPTKGAVNSCPGDVSFLTWPGGTSIEPAGPVAFFNGNLSGLSTKPLAAPPPASFGPFAMARRRYIGSTLTAAPGWPTRPITGAPASNFVIQTVWVPPMPKG